MCLLLDISFHGVFFCLIGLCSEGRLQTTPTPARFLKTQDDSERLLPLWQLRTTPDDSGRLRTTLEDSGWLRGIPTQATTTIISDDSRLRTTPNNSNSCRLWSTLDDFGWLRTILDNFGWLQTAPDDSKRRRIMLGGSTFRSRFRNYRSRIGVDSGFLPTLPITTIESNYHYIKFISVKKESIKCPTGMMTPGKSCTEH